MDSFYISQPLPNYENYNNQIYDYYPNEDNLLQEIGLKKKIERKNSIRKLKRKKSKLSSPIPPSLSFNVSKSDKESDLESLPDLIDDVDTPMSEQSSPMSMNNFIYLDKPKTLNFDEFKSDIESDDSLSDYQPKKLSIVNPFFKINDIKPQPSTPKVNIFEIPEIVYKIIEFASYQTDQPSIVRRKPDSYNHALLIHGNKQLAEQSVNEETPQLFSKVMFNCLQVNHLFNQVTKEILSKRFEFDDAFKLNQYLSKIDLIRPQEFKLDKLFKLSANEFDWQKFNFQNLHSIEIFMCPRFLPPLEMFHKGIKSLIICGSKVLHDNYLIEIFERCPNLEVLDIRGCEMITDSSIYRLSDYCKQLTSINLGRKQRGNLITDVSICKLVKCNPNLSTVGLAGCFISDKSIWEIAINCLNLMRLSLNNCPHLTNQSIPIILMTEYFKQLNVLEFKNTNITNLKPIIEFKRFQEFKGIPIIIEMCEKLWLNMRKQEIELDKQISEKIFHDIQDWVNESDDGDMNWESLRR